MPALNADDLVVFLPDDPSYLENGSDPADSRFLGGIDMNRRAVEHGCERRMGAAHNAHRCAFSAQAGEKVHEVLLAAAPVSDIVHKENFHFIPENCLEISRDILQKYPVKSKEAEPGIIVIIRLSVHENIQAVHCMVLHDGCPTSGSNRIGNNHP